MIYLFIGVGGAIGAICRFMLSTLLLGYTKDGFPFGTFIVNISGSFLLGLLVNLHLNDLIEDWVFYFAGIGFCGAFTTFSTFGNEVVKLILTNKTNTAIIYICSSLIVGIISAWFGLMV